MRFFICGLLCLSMLISISVGLQCFKDIQGIKRPDSNSEVIDVERFKRVNCSQYNPGNVKKPCMTKTDRNGIVTRNCATITKSEEVCEEDSHGSILCYCLTDYCNSASIFRSQKSALILLVFIQILFIFICNLFY